MLNIDRGVIEALVGETVEAAKVGLNASEVGLDPRILGLPRDHIEHRPREVDARHGETLGGESDRVSPRPAAQVDEAPRGV